MLLVKMIRLQACWLTCLPASLCYRRPWQCAASLAFWGKSMHMPLSSITRFSAAHTPCGNRAFGVSITIGGVGEPDPGGGKNHLLPASFAVLRAFGLTGERPSTRATYKHVPQQSLIHADPTSEMMAFLWEPPINIRKTETLGHAGGLNPAPLAC